MTSKSVKIYELRIPLEKISSLTAHHRYAYYLLGQIYNEMMSLQKIIGFAMPKHDDLRPARRNAEISQVFFLFRMAASKIYEAMAAINRKEVRDTLNGLVFSSSPSLRELLSELNKAVGGADWLSRMRNGMGFHYPKFSAWESYTTPDNNWTDDVVYMGERSGNTFFDSSANVTMHWMFDKYRGYQAAEAVNLLVDEMIDLIKKINEFTNLVVVEIVTKLISHEEPTLAGTVIAPEHDKVALPYWTFLRKSIP
jgi:hypothetical protein